MEYTSNISVIILNHNGFEHTRECLDSVFASTLRAASVIVVDNGSNDNSVKQLRSIFPEITYLTLKENCGYSLGNNIGIKHAFEKSSEYVLVLNNDTVLDKNCIATLQQAVSADKSIGIAGPMVLYHSAPDTINFAGINGNIQRASYKRIGLYEKDEGQYINTSDTLYQDGCAILISRDCYEQTGGFDERLWAYSEEFDLCIRARMAGFRVCCVQKAKVWHKISASFGSYYYRKPLAVYYSIRNNYILHRRYAGSKKGRLLVVLILFSRIPRQIVSIVFKRKIFRIKNLCMLFAATLVGITTNRHKPSDIFAPVKTLQHRNTIACQNS